MGRRKLTPEEKEERKKEREEKKREREKEKERGKGKWNQREESEIVDDDEKEEEEKKKGKDQKKKETQSEEEKQGKDEEPGERVRLAMILKQRREKRGKEVEILREEKRNLCIYCFRLCTDQRKICRSGECRRRFLLSSSLSPMKTRKCLARGCQNLLSVSHHGNFCRSKICFETREKEKMAFTRRVSAPLLLEEEKDAEAMEAEFREEMKEIRDRREIEEMINIMKDELIRENNPETHAQVVQEHSGELIKALGHLQTCFPKCICFNCGIFLFGSDLHWTNTLLCGISPPYPAEIRFHFIDGINDLIKEKNGRRKGQLQHFVSSCGFCQTNFSKEFFLEALPCPF